MSITSHAFMVYFPDGSEAEVSGSNVAGLLNRLTEKASSYWSDAVVIESCADNSGWIHLFFAPDYGWLVVCCGASDATEHFLQTDMCDADEFVVVPKAGGLERFPNSVFVHHHQMMDACRYFRR